MENSELLLRQMLWLRHGCATAGLYGDDGEFQCHVCGIDFLRDDPERIRTRFHEIVSRRNEEYFQSMAIGKEREGFFAKFFRKASGK